MRRWAMNEFLTSNTWKWCLLHPVVPGVFDEYRRCALHGDECERTQQPAVLFAIRRGRIGTQLHL